MAGKSKDPMFARVFAGIAIGLGIAGVAQYSLVSQAIEGVKEDGTIRIVQSRDVNDDGVRDFVVTYHDRPQETYICSSYASTCVKQ
jgi:hypothetical protein